MKSISPINVVKKLVRDNPNNMQLAELVRQYIRELIESERKFVVNNPKRI